MPEAISCLPRNSIWNMFEITMYENNPTLIEIIFFTITFFYFLFPFFIVYTRILLGE